MGKKSILPFSNLKIKSFALVVSLGLTGIMFAQNMNDYSIQLNKNWFIQSSSLVKDSGSAISSVSYSPSKWYRAQVPSTVMGTLVNDGEYPHIFVGKNLKKVSAARFLKPWWYRTSFIIPNKGLKTVKLEFDGINYRANIWFNGKLAASQDSIFGSFRRFELNVSKFAKIGQKNVLAVEVIPSGPGDFTIGFVDWNPKPPDHNMGIWRTVTLKLSGPVSINSPFVITKVDTQTLKSAQLTISAEIKNNSNQNISGELKGIIGDLKFSQDVSLNPMETKLVTFSADKYSVLNIKNPRLWWTHDYGKPELYHLQLTFNSDNKISDEQNVTFGIREVSDYVNKYGYRGYKLNGKKILIRGGGWVDHLFLANSYSNLEAQIQYAVQMNLNALRMEGFWGSSQDIYNLCDKYGILILAGWSCQWEWTDFVGKPADDYGAIKSPEDMKLISKSFGDQITWLRNHPSMLVWLYGSDKFPRPELEKMFLADLKKYDPTRPHLASAKGWVSTITGPTRVKMLGPYDYEPPSYWYVDTSYGGAYGFNTETGPGPQVPPVESIKKMIPADSLWPINNVWYFHCAANNFSTLNRYTKAMDERLGKANSLDEYCTKAQFLNYEGMRAMYEAFDANKYKSTGIIQWMYNAAWPKLWWQLYDYYLMPNGAFYGAKEAGQPIHIQYNYGNNSVDIVNNTLHSFDNIRVQIKLLNFDLSAKYEKSGELNIQPNTSVSFQTLPGIPDLSKTYFLDLKLYNNDGEVVSTNFYALSTKPDVLEPDSSTWYVTPQKEYADMTELNDLRPVKLKSSYKIIKNNGGEDITVSLENPSKNLAFMIYLSVKKGKGGESVLPIFWDDNYFSLLPGERRTIKGHYYIKDLDSETVYLQISGWNIKE
jgi:exo-1,4-beta-D-glucosaminidase